MKNPELYNKTVDILVQAYFNDELIVQDCTACACGNLVMAANNYKRVEFEEKQFWMDLEGNYIDPAWLWSARTIEHDKFFGLWSVKEQIVDIKQYFGQSKKEIISTGYKLHEFAAIEHAFEKGYRGYDKMFNALMAVIDVLDEIHEDTDTTISQTSKSKFNKLQKA